MELFKIIIKSFDFWFKMYNLILYLVSLSKVVEVKHNEDNYGNVNLTFYSIFVTSCAFALFFVVFFVDAMYLSNKTKQVIFIWLGIWMMYIWVSFYFTLDGKNGQFDWNPFSMYKGPLVNRQILI